MTPPVVSVIVLNFNGRRWLGECLASVLAQRGAPAFELLLADNASSDGSVEFVRERFPEVRVVPFSRNLGFAEANNRAARQALGADLVFLNNDTIAEPDWLARLHASLAERPDYAIAASRIVFMDDPRRLDSAGDGYLLAGGAFKHGHGEPVSADPGAREVFGACGAALLVRRDLFAALGGFDPRLFMVYEDVDLSYRARLRGYRCWYAADALVRHAGSGTLGRYSPLAVYQGQRNLELVWIKNTPAPLLLRTLPQHLVYSVAGLLFYARRGLIVPAVRGKLSALAALPAVLRDRSRTQRTRCIGVQQLTDVMTAGWLSQKRREKKRVVSERSPDW